LSLGPFGLIRHNNRAGRLTASVLISSIGDPLTLTVSLVLLYQATRTPLAVAFAFGTQMLAALCIGGLVGATADRLDRRRLIVRLEIIRFLLVLSLPLLVGLSVFLLYPALFLLGATEALVLPSRQASVPHLVARGEVGAANALLLTATTLGQATGFAVAGLALARLSDPRVIYVADAVTFAASAGVVASLGSLGGGVTATRLRGGVRRAWAVPGVAPLLLVAAATVFVIGMLNTALLPAAFQLSSSGPSAYTLLEICLIAGAVLGSLVAGTISTRIRMPALAAALWVFAAGVVGVGLSPSLWPASLAVALSGVGNAVYAVTNMSALMDAGSTQNRGTIMSARFTLTQAGKALGLGAGGLVTAWLGPRGSFTAFGAGLMAVATAYAFFLLSRRPGAATAPALRHPPPAPDPPAGRTSTP
jgi:MFS family permease